MDTCNPYGAGPRQFGSIVPGVFTPVLAKHTKGFSLVDAVSIGVDRMQSGQRQRRYFIDRWGHFLRCRRYKESMNIGCMKCTHRVHTFLCFCKFMKIQLLTWWRRRESNPRPKMLLVKSLHA